MARPINKEAYTKKRNDIIAMAMQLLYSKGYDAISMHEIKVGLSISSGTLHHYFKSRDRLLKALIECIGEEWRRPLLPILNASSLSATEKLQAFLTMFDESRNTEMDAVVHVLRGWYTEANGAMRQRVDQDRFSWRVSALSKIILQGKAEGAFTADHPDLTANLVARLLQDMEEANADLLLSAKEKEIDKCCEAIVATHAIYMDTLEFLLQLPKHTLARTRSADAYPWVVAFTKLEQTSGR